MRSCFAWLVITEWFSPLLDEDVFCFWTQMGFSHWHELVFDYVGKGIGVGHSTGSALSILISVSVLWCTITLLNLLVRSICEIRKQQEEMKGEWSGIVISLSMLQLTRCGKYSCFRHIFCGTAVWHEGCKSITTKFQLLVWLLKILS